MWHICFIWWCGLASDLVNITVNNCVTSTVVFIAQCSAEYCYAIVSCPSIRPSLSVMLVYPNHIILTFESNYTKISLWFSIPDGKDLLKADRPKIPGGIGVGCRVVSLLLAFLFKFCLLLLLILYVNLYLYILSTNNWTFLKKITYTFYMTMWVFLFFTGVHLVIFCLHYFTVSSMWVTVNVSQFCQIHVIIRDVTDSESVSESDGIRHFFRNPKSDGFFKSDRDWFVIANYCLNSVNCRRPK